MKKLQKGFAVIELMIVIAIIAILTTVIVPKFTEYAANPENTYNINNVKKVIVNTNPDDGSITYLGIMSDGTEVYLSSSDFANLPENIVIVK